MYKIILGLRRKKGLSRDDFGRYWTSTHAEKVKKVPGVVRYVINLAPDLTDRVGEMPYDGFAELWFENLETMEAAGTSPEAEAVYEDEENLFDMSSRFWVVVQEHVMIDQLGSPEVHRVSP